MKHQENKRRQLHKKQAASWNEFPLEELAENKIITRVTSPQSENSSGQVEIQELQLIQTIRRNIKQPSATCK
ncbi:hypothetical protein EB796_008501 [Bugula neritina]|uniref:Uncharacterized protein n=1 Tax=Bugula neritina TaxID=10212 RepID=A0A7J7K5N4_BUGNE|nr:hypothetical protein EB796_008501 [Bugula neritina]